MVLEDYTLKHVWGPRPDTMHTRSGLPSRFRPRSRLPSQPPHLGGIYLPERFSQRQKKPDPGQALRPFLRSCLFSNRSQGRDGADKLRPASIMRPQSNLIQFMRPYYDWIFGR